MGSKRKRESTGSAVAQTPESTSKAGPSSGGHGDGRSTPAPMDRKGKGKEVDMGSGTKEGSMVHYSSADGSHRWSKQIGTRLPSHLNSMRRTDSMIDRVDLSKDLKKSLRKVAKEVGIPKEQAGELRLAHIRDGGREADIWDGEWSGCDGPGLTADVGQISTMMRSRIESLRVRPRTLPSRSTHLGRRGR